MRQFVKFAAVFSLALSISLQSAVSAHEFGSKTSLTPPIIRYAEEAERLKSAIGPSGPALRGVYNQMKLWPSGTTLRGCFYDSDQQLRSYFLQAANRWLPGTSLRTDFGDASRGFRSCTKDSTEDIRVSFSGSGNWSYIGADSISPDVLKEGPSLNVETEGQPFDRLNLQHLEEVITHEFGHALGMLHEHQSPSANCGSEFDWPSVYSYAEKYWGWDQDKVRTNFAPYIWEPRLRTTPYDKTSVMHYALASWMYIKGTSSRCFVEEPRRLSKIDRATILAAYPADVALQSRELEKRAALASKTLSAMNLNSMQLGEVGSTLARSAKRINTKVKLQFALVPGRPLRAPTEELNPCQGSSVEIGGEAGLRCGVIPDASGFVIEFDPGKN